MEQGLSLGVQLLSELSAAVDALTAAAWQHAGTPGALEVLVVARMLIAFSQLQVSCQGYGAVKQPVSCQLPQQHVVHVARLQVLLLATMMVPIQKADDAHGVDLCI
jgi:hypothetical protein